MARPKDLKSVEELASNKSHGTRLRYMAGCKCVPCRAANSSYEVERSAARKRGEWNGIVSAKNARRHINELSKQGLGRRAIADASDVCTSTIQKIKAGRKKQIRAETEKRILDVSKEAIADGSLVCAKGTWQKIERLLNEGFTKKELAQRLGYKCQLQIGKVKVLASTKLKIEKLYNFHILDDEDGFCEDNLEKFIS